MDREIPVPSDDAKDWRDAVGPVFSADEVGRLLSASQDEVRKLISSGRLIGISMQEPAVTLIPAFQFTNGEIDPVIAEAAQVLQRDAVIQPLTVASWFRMAKPGLGNQTPLEFLRKGRDFDREKELILAAVRTRTRAAM
jgi:hypothetical protein